MTQLRTGFFTRLLDKAPPAERYRLATEQIQHAEHLGFDTAWIAQHHFHEHEGGLPSPLVFLAHAGALTRHIRLGTAVITLPMEDPLRVAEDTAVLDLLTQGRLDIGFGSGGTPDSFLAFDTHFEQRRQVFTENLHRVESAWRGDSLGRPDNRLYPAAAHLASRIWIATFSAEGAVEAARAGHGLMLSRTQPRPQGEEDLPLDAIQNPIVDAYLDALPAGVTPRILASRTAFVTDERTRARALAVGGLTRQATQYQQAGHKLRGTTLDDYIGQFDVHLGEPGDVLASLKQDSVLSRVTDVAFQVHSIEPPHQDILRSLTLLAREVLPALKGEKAAVRQQEEVK